MKQEDIDQIVEQDKKIAEVRNKLAGITMFNVVTEQIKDTHKDAVSYLLDNLKTIQGLFDERMK